MIDRALVVGLGSIGSRHLRLLRDALPDADIQVLRHNDCADSIPYANGCTTNLHDAVAFNPEIAVISSPAPYHIEVAKVLAGNGTHLLIEKPLSDSTEGVSNFLSTCRERKVVVQVAYNLRFLSTLQCFRREINSNRIGRVLSVRAETGQYLPSWRPDKDYRNTVSAKRSLGGGALLELSHEIDMLRWVFGEIEWVSSWHGKLSALDIDVEDCALVNVGFSCGAKGHVCIDFVRHDTTRRCDAIGESGTLRWDAISGEVLLMKPGESTWQTIVQDNPGRDDTYQKQIASFLMAVHEGKVSAEVSSGEDGLAALNFIDSVRQSSINNGSIIQLSRDHLS